MKLGYVWQDANDPFSLDYPDYYGSCRYDTKKNALKDFKVYASVDGFGWKPKISLWKIEATKVKVK